MGHQTWLANQCRKFGLQTEEYSGWTTRGSSSFNPQAAMAHWTAGPCGATGRPSLYTCVYGRANLPGPLCNIYLDRMGTCVVVAAGRANHAGAGGWRGLSGNSSVLGVEAECCNEGDWTDLQRLVYPTLMAALVTGIGRDESWICRHCDWAPSRKIDTRDLSLEWFQSNAKKQIDRVAGGGGTPVPVPPSGGTVEVSANLPVLGEGMRGQQVQMYQKIHNGKNSLPQPNRPALDEDGIFGPHTTKEVKAYQSWANLFPDGIVGANTWKSILEFAEW